MQGLDAAAVVPRSTSSNCRSTHLEPFQQAGGVGASCRRALRRLRSRRCPAPAAGRATAAGWRSGGDLRFRGRPACGSSPVRPGSEHAVLGGLPSWCELLQRFPLAACGFANVRPAGCRPIPRPLVRRRLLRTGFGRLVFRHAYVLRLAWFRCEQYSFIFSKKLFRFGLTSVFSISASSPQGFLVPVGERLWAPRRDLHHQVAAAAVPGVGHAAAPERQDTSPGCVPAGIVTSSQPSSVGTSMVAPKAACE